MGIVRRTYEWLDARLELDRELPLAGKAFPAEDSFLLGEVALFAFLILVLTGLFLGFFYEPSAAETKYQGAVTAYQGQEIPQAFESVLQITYEVPYGMFIRQLHHWAAHFFVAALGLHMLRVFFTGSYQNPREPNWIIGSVLAVLSMFAAYTGYALPYDEFATTATAIGYSIAQSTPIIGDMLSYIVFGGAFPSPATIPRLYFLHVFVLPITIALLIGVHLAILVRQKHTEARRDTDVEAEAGERRIDREDDSVVVGLPAFPNQAAISAVLFFLTLGVLSLLAGFLPPHNVGEYGPPDPAATPDLIMPDWYLMWIFGFLKVMPNWASFTIPGTSIHVSTEFLSGVVLPGIVFGIIFAWPFIDSRENPEHFTLSPYTRPWQTAAGVAGVVFVITASIAGMDMIISELTGVSTNVLSPILLLMTIIVPVVAGIITYAVLKRYDQRADVAADGGSVAEVEPENTSPNESRDTASREGAGERDGPRDDHGGDPE